MNKVIKRVLIILLMIVVLAAAVFLGIYFTRIQTIGSIEQLTDYEDGYNLYRMDVKYDYSIEDVNMQDYKCGEIWHTAPKELSGGEGLYFELA